MQILANIRPLADIIDVAIERHDQNDGLHGPTTQEKTEKVKDQRTKDKDAIKEVANNKSMQTEIIKSVITDMMQMATVENLDTTRQATIGDIVIKAVFGPLDGLPLADVNMECIQDQLTTLLGFAVHKQLPSTMYDSQALSFRKLLQATAERTVNNHFAALTRLHGGRQSGTIDSELDKVVSEETFNLAASAMCDKSHTRHRHDNAPGLPYMSPFATMRHRLASHFQGSSSWVHEFVEFQ